MDFDTFKAWAAARFEVSPKHTNKIKFQKKLYDQDGYQKFMKDNLELRSLIPELNSIFDLKFEEGNQIFGKVVGDLLSPPNHQNSNHNPQGGHSMKQPTSSTVTNEELQKYIQENCVYVNPTNNHNGEPFWFDVSQGCMSSITVTALKNTLSPTPSIEKNFYPYKSNARNAEVIYKPFIYNTLQSIDETKLFSLYDFPEWRLLPATKGNIHPELKEFFELLIPDEICRMYLFRWIKRSLTSVCPQHLFLIGRKGIGKGILVSELMTQLHGINNTVMGKRNALETPFNGALENTTLLFLDEMHVAHGNQKETLKLWCNKEISLEKKGKDSKTIKKTTSIILAANYLNSVPIDLTTDRKFSVMDLSQTELEKIRSKEWIENLIALTKDPSVLREFFDWVNLLEDTDPFEVYTGETYYKMALETLESPLEFVWEKIKDKEVESFDIRELRKEYARAVKRPSAGTKWITPHALDDFCKEFKYQGKQVAKVDVETGTLYPINDFKAEKGDL